MKMLLITLLICFSIGLYGQQDQAPAPVKKDKAKTEEKAEETEEQRSTRALSLEDLRQADERINAERELLAKQERRIASLIEDLNNQTTTIETKEASIRKMLDELKKTQVTEEVPAIQVAHWEARDPATAASDYIILFEESPFVAVALVKQMKKKRSAALIDEVAKVGDSGKKIAAKLHEAIGTGRVRQN